MALVLSIGVGNSASVIIGNLLGQNQLEKAKRFCKKYLIFTPIVAAAVAVILVLFAPMISVKGTRLHCIPYGHR